MSEKMRLVIDGVEHSLPREMSDPHAISLIGGDPTKVMLQRTSDGRYAGDTASIGAVFGDGDELELVPRPELP